ncbi:hypothetical protein [Xanthomonas sp. WHRI 6106]|uniref:hypothetical protein n=1 Tax=Xanthomonas sp. WHRI 6106 TaxID=3161566 RepID=UPI0032E8A55F
MTRSVDSAIVALAHAPVGDISPDDRRGESIARSCSGGALTTLAIHRPPGTALLALKKER